MPDRDVPVQGTQHTLVEHLGHQAHVLVDDDPRAVADGDAGRLLAAVLQCVETVVGELGDVLAGGPDPEYATCFPRRPIPRIQIPGHSPIALEPPANLITPISF